MPREWSVFPIALVSGQEHPRQGDVLELAQVAEASWADRPCSRAQPRASPNLPCATHTRVFNAATGRTSGVGTLDILALRLVEQVERAVQVALGFLDSRHGNAPAIARLR